MLEGRKVPAPLFTLRGHDCGVTALAECKFNNNNANKTYLISGDEEGTIILWDFEIYRKIALYKNFFESRIQSLNVIVLHIDENHYTKILIVQTRDHGVHIINLNYNLLNLQETKLKHLTDYPTYPSLFSRGTAINDTYKNNIIAILAYPSCLENYFVTIRILGENAVTILSGTAKRNTEEEKSSTVFDISIKKISEKEGEEFYLLGVAYEDGHLCLFKFSLDSTYTVPHLNSTGLNIELIKNYDLKICDFISAFDIFIEHLISTEVTLISGSPLAEIIFLKDSLKSGESLENLTRIALKKQGVTTIRIRPDNKLFVVSCWDNIIRLYSMKSKKLLATLCNHSKQIHDIIFIEKDAELIKQGCSYDEYREEEHGDDDKNCKITKNTTGNYLLCCASMEGVISITSIY